MAGARLRRSTDVQIDCAFICQQRVWLRRSRPLIRRATAGQPTRHVRRLSRRDGDVDGVLFMPGRGRRVWGPSAGVAPAASIYFTCRYAPLSDNVFREIRHRINLRRQLRTAPYGFATAVDEELFRRRMDDHRPVSSDRRPCKKNNTARFNLSAKRHHHRRLYRP